MPWIISNGKSYVEIIGNNQMITTAYIDRAHTFNNKKRQRNTALCCQRR